jgi:UDP-N-acetylglucosamine--N-acetylmuramyl-(pentapeptide) pyrophosphoryl-undecaprenol N-acetylglucosamine transferase
MNPRHHIVCIAGGHLSPAYALAAYIKRHYPEVFVSFIGREKAFTSAQYTAYSCEKDVMDAVCDQVEAFPIERPGNTIAFLRSIFYISNHFSKMRPSVVVSFGGYVGLAVGLAGSIHRIPVVIHEQTHALGLSNRLLGLLAKKICVSYKEMESEKHIYTGFPLREEVLHPPLRLSFPIENDKPLLYITGGTTGAVAVNELCFPILKQLLSTYTIVHQTGVVSFEKANTIKKQLPPKMRGFYTAVSYLHPKDASWLLHNATVVISRSGANIVYELALTKTRSVLLPLPQNMEQTANARWLTSYAPTRILMQDKASPEDVLRAVLYDGKHQMKFPKVDTDGTKRLCEQIMSIV